MPHRGTEYGPQDDNHNFKCERERERERDKQTETKAHLRAAILLNDAADYQRQRHAVKGLIAC